LGSGTRALASDLFSCPDRVTLRHKVGINVYYSNGAAKYIQSNRNSGFYYQIKDLPNGLGNFSVNYNPQIRRAYRDLDREGG
jgi:hypothetical protein